MEKLQMCRICLVENVRFYPVKGTLQELYEKLSDFPFVTEDSRPMLACVFCYTKLQQCCQLQRKCVKAEKLFTQFMSEDYQEWIEYRKMSIRIFETVYYSNIRLQALVGTQSAGDDGPKKYVAFLKCDKKQGTPLIYDGKLEYFGGLTTTAIEHMGIDDESQGSGEDLSAADDDDEVSLKVERDSEDQEHYIEIKVEPHIDGAPVEKKLSSDIPNENLEDTVTAQQNKTEIPKTESQKTQHRKSKPTRKVKKSCKGSNLQKHSLKSKDEKPYKCDECQRQFVLKHHLTNHMRIHSGEKPFKCHVCQRSFRLNKLLTVHLRVHTGEKPYTCQLCPKRFSQGAHLKHHILTHTGEKPYKCDSCPRTFRTKTYLDSHIRTHTGEKPFKCDVCQLGFINRPMLKTHIISGHSSGKPYKCEICQRGFNYQNNLVKHIRIHTGEKPYKCHVCQQSFIQKHALDIHVRNKHTGEKPYKCDICQRSFSASSVLKNHMITHTGEKPFKCDVCLRSFNRKGTLSTHIRTHSDEKQYQCEICAKSFRQVSTLNVHLRVHSRENK